MCLILFLPEDRGAAGALVFMHVLVKHSWD